MGCKIKWIGKRIIKFMDKKTKEINAKVMPDRIEAGTYLIAAAVTLKEI